MEILIPHRFSDNFGEPINYLTNLLISINETDPSEVTFNFSGSKFISPFIIGGIVAIANSLESSGKRIYYIMDKQDSGPDYLRTINFPLGYNFKDLNSGEMNKGLEIYNLKTFIPLVLFSTNTNATESAQRENVLSAINSILKNQLNLKGNVLEAIFYMIDELTNNVADHSQSGKGILFAQFYSTKNYMDVCIADFGKGIKQTYLDSGKAIPVSHEEAMEFAVNGKSTKDQAISRGFGISTSRKMLTEGLKGKFILYSGNALFYQNSEKQEIISLPEAAFYKGCLATLRIPTFPNAQFDFYKYAR